MSFNGRAAITWAAVVFVFYSAIVLIATRILGEYNILAYVLANGLLAAIGFGILGGLIFGHGMPWRSWRLLAVCGLTAATITGVVGPILSDDPHGAFGIAWSATAGLMTGQLIARGVLDWRKAKARRDNSPGYGL